MVSMTAGVISWPRVRHDPQLARRNGAVGRAGGLDRAEHVAVAGEDQGRGGDGGEVPDRVPQAARWPGRRRARGTCASDPRPGRRRSRPSWWRRRRPWRGHGLERPLGGVGVGGGGVRAAAEDRADGTGGPWRWGRSSRSRRGSRAPARRRGGGARRSWRSPPPSLNPATSGRSSPRASIRASDVVGEDVERRRSAGVHGGAGAAGVGGDDAEVLPQRGHVVDVGDGEPAHAGPVETSAPWSSTSGGPSPTSV